MLRFPFAISLATQQQLGGGERGEGRGERREERWGEGTRRTDSDTKEGCAALGVCEKVEREEAVCAYVSEGAGEAAAAGG